MRRYFLNIFLGNVLWNASRVCGVNMREKVGSDLFDGCSQTIGWFFFVLGGGGNKCLFPNQSN